MTPTTSARFSLPDTSVSPLFDGWQAGHYDLPAVLTEAGARFLELVKAREDARHERDRLYPNHHHTLAGRDAFEAADDAAGRTRDACDRSLRGIEGMIAGLADVLIVGSLRPAHDDALAGVRAVLPALEDVADLADFAAVARAGAKASAGFVVIVAAAERLRAIDTARECVYDRVRVSGGWRDVHHDARGDGYLRDTPVWPTRSMATVGKGARLIAGPSGLNRTRWLATEAGAGWCPTPTEWEAAYLEWTRDPGRNGRPTGPVPMVRGGYITRPGSRRQVPTG